MSISYPGVIKPVLDSVMALLGLLMLWPLFIVIGILIKLDSRGEIIFKQERMGKGGKIFTVYKFRTMIPNAVNEGAGYDTFDGDYRITRIGRILRKTSLDELPQLWNILRGDMAIIGPRPLLPTIPYSLEEYPEQYRPRLSVRPGLFCVVDTELRALASVEQQFESDVDYVSDINFKRDVCIMTKVALMVLQQKGIYRSADKKDSNQS